MNKGMIQRLSQAAIVGAIGLGSFFSAMGVVIVQLNDSGQRNEMYRLVDYEPPADGKPDRMEGAGGRLIELARSRRWVTL